MSKILLTGCAGFIGARTTEMLLEQGHEVVGIDNMNNYYDTRLKDYRLSKLLGLEHKIPADGFRTDEVIESGPGSKSIFNLQSSDLPYPISDLRYPISHLPPPTSDLPSPISDLPSPTSDIPSPISHLPYPTSHIRTPISDLRINSDIRSSISDFSFYPIDIEDLPSLQALFAEHAFDAVINLAARAGVRYSMINPHIYMSTNAQGTLNLLECMKDHGVKKFVLASTSSLYAGQPMPFKEDLPVNEPISPYAASKKAAEAMAYTYHHLYDIDVSILRYFTVYGPLGRPDMSPFRFAKWIKEGTPITLYGDGTQARDFTHVDDIARGTIMALKPVGYEIINLGGGNNPISINQMIEMMEEELGENAIVDQKPFNESDMKVTWANVDKAGELLGWKVSVSFEEGLAPLFHANDMD